MITAERKSKEKGERRKIILDAALKLFSSKGYENVTMDDVARETGLAKGTLYLYFKNKETLYVAAVIPGITIFGEMVEQAMAAEKRGISKVYAGGLAYYEFSKKYPVYFDMMLDAQKRWFSGDLGEAIRTEFATQKFHTWLISVDAIRMGISDGTIRKDADPNMTATFLIETTTAMIRASLESHVRRGGSLTTRDELVYFTLDMLGHAIENKGDHRW
ncbi:MAG TPA: TetR/AcrR family transcriptional regulator [Methanocella sp.]|nr:TetR/AcrR family transcriptional regulator [Methanocella sp.]